jgi:hypothetical protein
MSKNRRAATVPPTAATGSKRPAAEVLDDSDSSEQNAEESPDESPPTITPPKPKPPTVKAGVPKNKQPKPAAKQSANSKKAARTNNPVREPVSTEATRRLAQEVCLLNVSAHASVLGTSDTVVALCSVRQALAISRTCRNFLLCRSTSGRST